MAQHDFINKKPGNRKSKKQPPKKKPLPILLIILAVLLIGGFSFGLWYVKKNADPKLVEQQANPTEAKSEPKVAKPRPPEFIKEIKEQEIQVTIKKLEQKGPYVMQCGSFKTKSQAETLKAKIAFAGLIAEIKKSTGSNGVWYKVRLGPYKTKRLAESDKNKLKRSKVTGCGIWFWT
ncbi:MAG: SPOR domain-containing protein [Pseudoalteromonas sp.]|uniref:SPOR domain-containing protein n=1 Tax=Pseudoalteromonas sp. TaxID=53249 RepID=UPI003F946F39